MYRLAYPKGNVRYVPPTLWVRSKDLLLEPSIQLADQLCREWRFFPPTEVPLDWLILSSVHICRCTVFVGFEQTPSERGVVLWVFVVQRKVVFIKQWMNSLLHDRANL